VSEIEAADRSWLVFAVRELENESTLGSEATATASARSARVLVHG
jgi:hypothetical protein